MKEKEASVTSLMYEFNIDFYKGYSIIEQLEKANIIKTYKNKIPVRRIAVQTKQSLDVYFKSKR